MLRLCPHQKLVPAAELHPELAWQDQALLGLC